jgi:hypothetical protein
VRVRISGSVALLEQARVSAAAARAASPVSVLMSSLVNPLSSSLLIVEQPMTLP